MSDAAVLDRSFSLRLSQELAEAMGMPPGTPVYFREKEHPAMFATGAFDDLCAPPVPAPAWVLAGHRLVSLLGLIARSRRIYDAMTMVWFYLQDSVIQLALFSHTTPRSRHHI